MATTAQEVTLSEATPGLWEAAPMVGAGAAVEDSEVSVAAALEAAVHTENFDNEQCIIYNE